MSQTPNSTDDDVVCPVCNQQRSVVDDTPLLQLDKGMLDHNADPFRRAPGWSVELARQGHLNWACNPCLIDGKALSAQPWLQEWGDFEPFYAYYNKDMTCADCKTDFVFSADEQRFWYEEKRFPVVSYPKHCLDCRRKRRGRKKGH